MVGGEKFTFDQTGHLHYTNFIRPLVKGMYSPITTNPHSYRDISDDIASSFRDGLTRISLNQLSRLTHRIHHEPDFSVAILVLLEASSIRSLLIIPSSFAVIIEQLSKHLSRPEVGLEKPIQDSSLAQIIIKELHMIIERYRSLSDSTVLKLKRRLNSLNHPVNKQKLTNNEKLTRPFEQLGIALTLHDIAIIEHRNDLLHGNILLTNDTENKRVDQNLYMTYVSAKLFTLISKLILKSVGYDGYVYNQAKYLEKHLNIETGEEYFERI